MSQIRMPFVQTRRDAWVEVNLNHIEHNIKQLKGLIPKDTKFLAVVKADAYGHGSTMVAPNLAASGVDMFGVASVDEGLQLRESGISSPILVLGTAPSWSFVSAIENDIQLSVFTDEHIQACIQAYEKLGKKPVVQVKVDTGMHRIGIGYNFAEKFIKNILDTECIELAGVFTHFACAEIPEITQMQKSAWEKVISTFKDSDLTLHCANTAATMGYDDSYYNMVRSGIGIYGLMPDLPETNSNKPDLKQAMSLRGRIVYLKELEPDCGISYGYSYKTQNPVTKIATVPVGYADGVPRALSNQIYGILNGQIVKQVGNITMDQMMFDISDVDDANIGDIITLLGNDDDKFISIDDWAEKLSTINYEITCRLRVRLPRVYTRE